MDNVALPDEILLEFHDVQVRRVGGETGRWSLQHLAFDRTIRRMKGRIGVKFVKPLRVCSNKASRIGKLFRCRRIEAAAEEQVARHVDLEVVGRQVRAAPLRADGGAELRLVRTLVAREAHVAVDAK